MSYVDLLNLPYNQQIAPAANIGNSALRGVVGQNASLLDTKKNDIAHFGVKKKCGRPNCLANVLLNSLLVTGCGAHILNSP